MFIKRTMIDGLMNWHGDGSVIDSVVYESMNTDKHTQKAMRLRRTTRGVTPRKAMVLRRCE